MPDILTGEEEIEIVEAISALESAIARLDPVGDAAAIVALKGKIEALTSVIDAEVLTPLLCPTCNHKEDMPDQYCPTCNNALDLNGKALKRPNYLPLGVA